LLRRGKIRDSDKGENRKKWGGKWELRWLKCEGVGRLDVCFESLDNARHMILFLE